MTDDALRARNRATLLACFEQNALGARDARVVHAPGVAVAVFAAAPESAFFNNAVLDRGLPPAELASAVEAVRIEYATAGVAEYAVWTTEGDGSARRFLETHGYRRSETTLAMSAEFRASAPAPGPAIPGLEIVWGAWDEYVELLEIPGFLAGADRDAYRIATARLDGVPVAAGMAFHHDGDCGIFNVGTVESARRRGIGAAVTRALLDDGAVRGQATASLQSTPMGERVYASVGFHAVDRILEFTPLDQVE